MQNETNITENEKAALVALRINDYCDAYYEATWSFAAIDRLEKVNSDRRCWAGVFGSLVKKGLLHVSGPCGDDDSSAYLTDAGKAVCDELKIEGMGI